MYTTDTCLGATLKGEPEAVEKAKRAIEDGRYRIDAGQTYTVRLSDDPDSLTGVEMEVDAPAPTRRPRRGRLVLALAGILAALIAYYGVWPLLSPNKGQEVAEEASSQDEPTDDEALWGPIKSKHWTVDPTGLVHNEVGEEVVALWRFHLLDSTGTRSGYQYCQMNREQAPLRCLNQVHSVAGLLAALNTPTVPTTTEPTPAPSPKSAKKTASAPAAKPAPTPTPTSKVSATPSQEFEKLANAVDIPEGVRLHSGPDAGATPTAFLEELQKSSGQNRAAFAKLPPGNYTVVLTKDGRFQLRQNNTVAQPGS